jgi:hypothetical protein
MIVGAVLLVLGGGNSRFGASKAAEYRSELRAAKAAGGRRRESPYRGTAAILERPTDAQLMYETASTKYQYYKLVRRGGRVFAVLGLFLVGGAFLRRVLVPHR